MRPYKITVATVSDTETDATIRFPFPGVGNSPEAETIKHNALRSAKRRLRKTISVPHRYHIESNKIDSMNRLHELVVRATIKD